jgi:hypothetical protein
VLKWIAETLFSKITMSRALIISWRSTAMRITAAVDTQSPSHSLQNVSADAPFHVSDMGGCLEFHLFEDQIEDQAVFEG